MYAGRMVEAGAARRAVRAPRHPYTRGLLGSIPRPDARPRTRWLPIPGAGPR